MAIAGVRHRRQLHPDARSVTEVRRPPLIAGRIAALVKKPIDDIARGRGVAVSIVGGRSHITVVTAFAIKRERSARGIHMLTAASGLPLSAGRAVQRRDCREICVVQADSTLDCPCVSCVPADPGPKTHCHRHCTKTNRPFPGQRFRSRYSCRHRASDWDCLPFPDHQVIRGLRVVTHLPSRLSTLGQCWRRLIRIRPRGVDHQYSRQSVLATVSG